VPDQSIASVPYYFCRIYFNVIHPPLIVSAKWALVELPVIFFYEIRNLSALTTLLLITFTVFCPVLRISPESEFVWIDFT
jgi:hypothetical protein